MALFSHQEAHPALLTGVIADEVPFAPETATCSTAHSTGPGTTLNDFVPTFDYNPSCGQ
ncbi:MAG: hypothetical protein AAF721_30205 [Myxococcota bacterium]